MRKILILLIILSILCISPAMSIIDYPIATNFDKIDYNNPLPIYSQISYLNNQFQSPVITPVVIAPTVTQKSIVKSTPLPTQNTKSTYSSCECNTNNTKYNKVGNAPNISKIIRFNFAPGITPDVDRVLYNIEKAQKDGILFPCLKFVYDPTIKTKHDSTWSMFGKTDIPDTSEKWIMIIGDGLNTASVPNGWVMISAIDSVTISHEWSHVFAYWYKVTDKTHGGKWDATLGKYTVHQIFIDYQKENCPNNTVLNSYPYGNENNINSNFDKFVFKALYDKYYKPSICG
jgi:hypothetical protein